MFSSNMFLLRITGLSGITRCWHCQGFPHHEQAVFSLKRILYNVLRSSLLLPLLKK